MARFGLYTRRPSPLSKSGDCQQSRARQWFRAVNLAERSHLWAPVYSAKDARRKSSEAQLPVFCCSASPHSPPEPYLRRMPAKSRLYKRSRTPRTRSSDTPRRDASTRKQRSQHGRLGETLIWRAMATRSCPLIVLWPSVTPYPLRSSNACSSLRVSFCPCLRWTSP